MQCSIIDIGARIAAMRNKRKLSQDDLAKKLNVSREVVAKWENGTRDLKTQYSIALADFFGVTCDEILRGIKSENVEINRELGLSDLAITQIRRSLREQEYIGALNSIISSPYLFEFLKAVSSYKHALYLKHINVLIGAQVFIDRKGVDLTLDELYDGVHITSHICNYRPYIYDCLGMSFGGIEDLDDAVESKEYKTWKELNSLLSSGILKEVLWDAKKDVQNEKYNSRYGWDTKDDVESHESYTIHKSIVINQAERIEQEDACFTIGYAEDEPEDENDSNQRGNV